jgi:hypothetical protein
MPQSRPQSGPALPDVPLATCRALELSRVDAREINLHLSQFHFSLCFIDFLSPGQGFRKDSLIGQASRKDSHGTLSYPFPGDFYLQDSFNKVDWCV